jgi:hypothetical protein
MSHSERGVSLPDRKSGIYLCHSDRGVYLIPWYRQVGLSMSHLEIRVTLPDWKRGSHRQRSLYLTGKEGSLYLTGRVGFLYLTGREGYLHFTWRGRSL